VPIAAFHASDAAPDRTRPFSEHGRPEGKGIKVSSAPDHPMTLVLTLLRLT
jgi:hypothetical protein